MLLPHFGDTGTHSSTFLYVLFDCRSHLSTGAASAVVIDSDTGTASPRHASTATWLVTRLRALKTLITLNPFVRQGGGIPDALPGPPRDPGTVSES